MAAGPSGKLELFAGSLIPPACREEVLGDLGIDHEADLELCTLNLGDEELLDARVVEKLPGGVVCLLIQRDHRGLVLGQPDPHERPAVRSRPKA